MVVGHGRAPVGHRTFGVRLLDLLKLREGSRVPEVVEKNQSAIEAGLHGWSAGRLHMRSANTFGAVAVLCEQPRGAKRPHQRRGQASTDEAATRHTPGMSIDWHERPPTPDRRGETSARRQCPTPPGPKCSVRYATSAV